MINSDASQNAQLVSQVTSLARPTSLRTVQYSESSLSLHTTRDFGSRSDPSPAQELLDRASKLQAAQDPLGERNANTQPERISAYPKSDHEFLSTYDSAEYSQNHSYPSPDVADSIEFYDMNEPYAQRAGGSAPVPGALSHAQNFHEPSRGAIPSPSSMASTMATNAEARQANMSSRSPSQIPEPKRRSPSPNERFEPQLSASIEPPHSGASALQEEHFEPKASQPSHSVHTVTELKPRLGILEFAVPLSLPGRIRDEYFKTIQYSIKALRRFRGRSVDEETIEEVRSMLTRLDNISTFTDLDNKSALSQPQDVDLADECGWAVNCSSKFQFLRGLLERLRRQKKHIIIVARSGQLQNILERFLAGYRIHSGRLHNDLAPAINGIGQVRQSQLLVSLATTNPAHPPTKFPASDLIIAFDSSVDISAPYMQELRSRSAARPLGVNSNGASPSPAPSGSSGVNGASSQRPRVPLLRLLVYCAVEHLSLCAPAGLATSLDRLRFTVDCIGQTEAEVGELAIEEHRADAAAEEAAAFVAAGGAAIDWILAPMRPIKLVEGVTFVNASQNPTATATMGEWAAADGVGQKKRSVVIAKIVTLFSIHVADPRAG